MWILELQRPLCDHTAKCCQYTGDDRAESLGQPGLQAHFRATKSRYFLFLSGSLLHAAENSPNWFHVCMLSSVQFSRSVVSDSLWPYGLQHARPPSPSPTPGAYSNSCPLHQWCHPTISSSVVPFSFRPQSFPASGSFPLSWFFASGGQSIGVSASTSVLPMTIQDWLPWGLTGWISLLSKGLSRVFSNTTVQKHQFFSAQLSL